MGTHQAIVQEATTRNQTKMLIRIHVGINGRSVIENHSRQKIVIETNPISAQNPIPGSLTKKMTRGVDLLAHIIKEALIDILQIHPAYILGSLMCIV